MPEQRETPVSLDAVIMFFFYNLLKLAYISRNYFVKFLQFDIPFKII